MVGRWAEWVCRFRWGGLIAWVLLFGAGIYYASDLPFRFNLGHMLRGNDEKVQEVRDFYKLFPPSDGHIAVSASSDSVLTMDHLRAAAEWADQFAALPEVGRVIGPRDVLDLKLDGFTLDEWARLGGKGSDELLMGDGPGMETIKGSVISRDSRSVAVYLLKAKGVRSGKFHSAVEKLARQSAPWDAAEVRLAGLPYVLREMGGLLEKNFRRVLFLSLAGLMLVVPLFMKTLRRSYLPVLCATTALLVFGAVASLAGMELGVIHLAAPGLILIIGVADAIHLQQVFDEARSEGQSARDSMVVMFQRVGKACFLTSFTSICGFMSLTIAPHEEIYEFGLWCSLGVFITFVVVMLFMPFGVALFPGKGSPSKEGSWFRLNWLRQAALPVVCFLVVLILGGYRTELDSSLDRELPSSNQVVMDMDWFGKNFRGMERVEVDVRADLQDPEVASLVRRMQDDLESFPGISGSRSFLDLMNASLDEAVITTDSGLILGLTAIGSNELSRGLITEGLDRACLVFYRTKEFGTDAFESFEKKVAGFARKFPEGSSVMVNGQLPMFYESTRLISRTMALNLCLSVFTITAVLIVVFRSFRIGLLCLVPNLVPLLCVVGFSGWIGAPLHLGILVVFSIGLGLAVDDTIHFVERFRQIQRQRPDIVTRAQIDLTMLSVGRSITLTSIVLLIISVCFLAADFTTMRWVGVTLAIIAVSALLADLIVLPWMLERSPPRKAIPE